MPRDTDQSAIANETHPTAQKKRSTGPQRVTNPRLTPPSQTQLYTPAAARIFASSTFSEGIFASDGLSLNHADLVTASRRLHGTASKSNIGRSDVRVYDARAAQATEGGEG